MRKVQATLPLGTVIQGRYVVEGVLGSASPGAVYLVRDQSIHQHLFVLKEMSNSGKEDGYRFTFEHAEFKKKFVHPALPQVYNMFHDEKHDRVYILMEYVEGLNLEAVRLVQPEQLFSLPQVMTIMSPIMDAVIYLHSQHPPLIHGHIKPSNIIESTDTSTVLVGFGHEKEYDAEETITIVRHATSSYGAPEQYVGEINPRTDIYALGATLYTLLTGIVPPDSLYRTKKLGNKEPDPLVAVNQLTPTVPTPIAEAIHHAMSINRDERFSTVEQYWEALQQASNTPTTEQQTTEPAVTAPSEEKTESQTHHSPVQQAVEPPIGIEEAPTLTTGPTGQQPAEAVVVSPDSPHTPVISGAVKSRVTRPLQAPAQVRRFQKSGMLFLTLFALLVTLLGSVGVVASLWFYITSQHSATFSAPSSGSQLAEPSPHPTVSPQPTVVPTPSSTSSANIAELYNGTIYDIPANVTTEMSLTGIQQTQITISGYFTGLHLNGPFKGTFDISKHVQFKVMDNTGRALLSFDGMVLSDNTIAGNYCSLDQEGQCNGKYGYGLWSVVPAS